MANPQPTEASHQHPNKNNDASADQDAAQKTKSEEHIVTGLRLALIMAAILSAMFLVALVSYEIHM